MSIVEIFNQKVRGLVAVQSTVHVVMPPAIPLAYPEGPCTQILYTLALKYPYRSYFKGQGPTM